MKYTKGSIIKFGGYAEIESCNLDSFWISSRVPKDGLGLEWTQKPTFKLPKAMVNFGYVIYKSIIIIFGGPDDDIYHLDLENDTKGWKKSAIKCPVKDDYVAVIHGQNIHFYTITWNYEDPKHFEVSIKSIIQNEEEQKEIDAQIEYAKV